MIKGLTKKLVSYQLQKPYLVLGILLLLLTVAVYGFTTVTVKPSTEAILPADNEAVNNLDQLRATFYGDIVTMVIREDITSYAVLEKIDGVTNRLQLVENVGSVQSPTTHLQQTYGSIPRDNVEIQEIQYGPLVNSQRSLAVIQVQTDTQAKTEEIRQLRQDIESILRGEGLLENTRITGYNMIDLDMFGVIISDFTKITGIAFTAVLTALYIIFRSVKKIILAILPVMYALVLMLGIGSMLGAELTIISMVSAAMIMGLGIDFGIHIVTKLYNTQNITKQHMFESMDELSKGLLGGALTTSTGFLALLAAQLTGMHSLGIYLAIGILGAYIGVIGLLPTIIILLEKPQ